MLSNLLRKLLTVVLVALLLPVGATAQAASKKSQTISWSKVTEIALKDAPTAVRAKASSKLAVKVTNLTPDVCRVTASALSGIKVGTCKFTLTQAGNAKFKPAPKVTASVAVFDHDTVSFTLPSTATVGDPAISLSASAKSGNTVTFATSSSTCSVEGSKLTLKSAGDCVVAASTPTANGFLAETVSQTITIVLARSTIDRPDTVDGWQLHAIYVQPADALDRKVDVNGYLATALTEGNTYLSKQLGLTMPIDRTDAGFDIRFIKSKYSSDQIMAMEPTQLPALMTELKPTDSPGQNRKNYVFFVDVPMLNGNYCGWADRPGMAAVVAIGKPLADAKFVCTGAGHGFNDYVTKTWVHEVFHNLGVEHNNDACDLMYAGPEQCAGNYTIDAQRRLYVGSSIGGADITRQRVWVGYTANTGLRADCYVHMEQYPRTDATPYVYCPVGTHPIGTMLCYTAVSTAELQQLVNGVWTTIASGNRYYKPWGEEIDFACTNPSYPDGFWASVTVTTPGTVRYRWLLNNFVQNDEVFDVIYLR